jgi:hypothetical protein
MTHYPINQLTRSQAGLFSAAITQFIASTSTALVSDHDNRTNQLLFTLIQVTTPPGSSVTIPSDDFKAPVVAVVINSIFFFSLILSLLAALGAILVKQWVRHYHLGGEQGDLSWKRALDRELRSKGLTEWKIPGIIAWIPILLHLALALFLVGVVLWCFTLHSGVFAPIIVLTGLGALAYFSFAIIATFDESAPYRWPVSAALRAAIVQIKRTVGHTAQDMRIADIEKAYASTNPPAAKFIPLARIPDEDAASLLPEADACPPSIPYILCPAEDFNSKFPRAEQSKPKRCSSLDLDVFIHVLRQSEVHHEIEFTLDTMRTAPWDIPNLPQALLEHGDIILLRCDELASTCWYRQGSLAFLEKGKQDRARRVCYFLEWFYYGLSYTQRQTLRNWPSDHVARALAEGRIDGNERKTSEDDLLIASSVISKLRHVRLGPGKYCTTCFVKQTRNNDDIRSRLRAAGVNYDTRPNLLEKSKIDAKWQAKVSACISSDIDCLLYYLKVPDQQALGTMLTASSNTWRSVAYIWNAHINRQFRYAKLLENIGQIRKLLDSSDTARVAWLSSIEDAVLMVSIDLFHTHYLIHFNLGPSDTTASRSRNRRRRGMIDAIGID